MKNDVGQRFNEVLTELKKSKKINSYGEFAQKAGFKSTSSVSGIISGQSKPTIELMQLMKKYYNVNPDYIVSGVGNMFLAIPSDTLIPEKSSQASVSEHEPPYNKEGGDFKKPQNLYQKAINGVSDLYKYLIFPVGAFKDEGEALGKAGEVIKDIKEMQAEIERLKKELELKSKSE